MSLTNPPWMELLAGAMSGGLITKGADWLAKRGKSQAYTMGAVDHAVQTAMGLVTERLTKVEGQHEDCEKNLREVRDDLQDSKRQHERERAELKAEIERLMAQHVPSYAAGDLTRRGDA